MTRQLYRAVDIQICKADERPDQGAMRGDLPAISEGVRRVPRTRRRRRTRLRTAQERVPRCPNLGQRLTRTNDLWRIPFHIRLRLDNHRLHIYTNATIHDTDFDARRRALDPETILVGALELEQSGGRVPDPCRVMSVHDDEGDKAAIC